MMGEIFFLVLIVFLSSLIHSTFGFGFSAICMTLLSFSFNLDILLPLIPLLYIIGGFIIVLQGWKSVEFKSILTLSIGATLIIPFGVFLGLYGNEFVIKTLLGLVIIFFSLYNLFTPELPLLKNDNFAILFGGLSGLFGGAYNILGPPIVIYGTLRQWSPTIFKSSLQVFFLYATIITICTHICLKSYNNPLIYSYFCYALPAMILGVPLGNKLNRSIQNPRAFTRAVYILLLTLGILLILKAFEYL